jgi:hypothetical protein
VKLVQPPEKGLIIKNSARLVKVFREVAMMQNSSFEARLAIRNAYSVSSTENNLRYSFIA